MPVETRPSPRRERHPARAAAARTQEAAAEPSSGDPGVTITADQTASPPHTAAKPRAAGCRGIAQPTRLAAAAAHETCPSQPRSRSGARRRARGPGCCPRPASVPPHPPARQAQLPPASRERRKVPSLMLLNILKVLHGYLQRCRSYLIQ